MTARRAHCCPVHPQTRPSRTAGTTRGGAGSDAQAHHGRDAAGRSDAVDRAQHADRIDRDRARGTAQARTGTSPSCLSRGCGTCAPEVEAVRRNLVAAKRCWAGTVRIGAAARVRNGAGIHRRNQRRPAATTRRNARRNGPFTAAGTVDPEAQLTSEFPLPVPAFLPPLPAPGSALRSAALQRCRSADRMHQQPLPGRAVFRTVVPSRGRDPPCQPSRSGRYAEPR